MGTRPGGQVPGRDQAADVAVQEPVVVGGREDDPASVQRPLGVRPGVVREDVLQVHLRGGQALVAELKAIGVKLAIDDFGTGYSSLSYLRELPIDVLKMDKSFVDGIAVSEQRLALAEGIVQIARTLRLEVIAEGIESEVQRDLLV